MRIPEHLTCLLRNLYASQKATVRTGHGTTDWIQIRKGVGQGCILSPCLYAECIMRNLRAHKEATVRTRHGKTDWFQTGKGVCQGYILSTCLFNLYEEYSMKNPGLSETQAGIKIPS